MDNRKTVVLAGASGFIGGYFRTRFEQDGWQVRTIGRPATDTGADTARWGDDAGITKAIDGADLLVNLAGRSVNCRYNAAEQGTDPGIPRVDTTAELGRCGGALLRSPGDLAQRQHRNHLPPRRRRASVGATTASWAKASPWMSPGLGSLPWPRSETPLTRKVPLRISIVLGPGAGVMRPLANLARLGLGGPMGSGRQKFSWVHVEDLYRSVLFVHQRRTSPGR